MRSFLFLSSFILFGIASFSQSNFSGIYSYSFKAAGNPPQEHVNEGPAGSLSLLKMDGNKYRFWLDVNIGWPSYNQGIVDGTLTWKNDAAFFEVNFEGDEHPCQLYFKKKGNMITIDSRSTSFNCGFGHGVSADGDYARDKKQPLMNAAWLKEQYSQSSYMVVVAKKALLYQDEAGLRPYPAGTYFVKGNRLVNIDELENTVYTEFITPAGKFVYGWVRKKDVKLLDFGE
jgi:hypothetical protein